MDWVVLDGSLEGPWQWWPVEVVEDDETLHHGLAGTSFV